MLKGSFILLHYNPYPANIFVLKMLSTDDVL